LNRWIHGFSFLLFFPAALSQLVAGPEGAKILAGKWPPPDSDPYDGVDSGENYATLSSPNRRFQFHKRAEYFVGAHDETPSVVAVSVNNPDRSPVGVNR
jgi:hypothetical protein